MFDLPYYLLWLIAVIFLVVLEAATLGLTCIWFALGALVGLLASLLGMSFFAQIVIFVVVSGLCLIMLKPFATKHLFTNRTATNADRVIGATGIVVEAINNEEAKGLVKVGGQIWTARSIDSKVSIPEGVHVLIRKIDGVKLLVEEAKEEIS
ncbi:MAG: NfeD family protein [Clostridiaceae bacterium]|nr:NfeD family protein [Clostridiaceae bacterium]